MASRTFGAGYKRTFAENHLTLGVGFPIEAYEGPVAELNHQIARAKAAERGGFATVWCRDIPVYDPSFGDLGQIYDPWAWLGYVAAQTSTIALGTGSIILPLRAPVDTAKAACSVDHLSGGRLVFGVASGDRPVEYSVFNKPFDDRGDSFVEAFKLIRNVSHRPDDWNNKLVAQSNQLNVLPKSVSGDLPMLVTGNSRQSVEWIAEHADGWLMYPRPLFVQKNTVNDWQTAVQANGQHWKPFAQSLYIDLTENPNEEPSRIHLGFRLGRNPLITHLEALRECGVNHVLFNVKFSSRPVDDVLAELCEFVVPQFPAINPGQET